MHQHLVYRPVLPLALFAAVEARNSAVWYCSVFLAQSALLELVVGCAQLHLSAVIALDMCFVKGLVDLVLWDLIRA